MEGVKMADTKALQVMSNKGGPHYKVGWKGGGEVPEALSGLFTDQGIAQQAIEIYVTNKNKSKKG